MLLLKFTVLGALCIGLSQAVLNGKELHRREAGFDSYGPPPRPAPQYGPPPSQQQQHIPHREYGVPQQIPFREYGPPAAKYGPPKLNFLGGGGGGGGGGSSFSGGFHEQIKTHFGVPKPFYGPPHIQHRPQQQYGPPPPQPQAQYGPPPPQPQAQYGPPPQQQYGPPPKPNYGPPPPFKLQHRPAPNYGPPKPQYGPPPLPAPHPGPLFKPAHQPATSYGPPASGPLNLPPKPIYDVPPPNYGPPPLPINLPGPQPANFNRGQETTIIVSGAGGQHLPVGGPVKQVQIQIDDSGHTHSVSGSQAPFHTACDGWKPIPAPVGSYIEHNHIDTQGGYSHVAQGASFGTQYNSGGSVGGDGGSAAGGSIIDGLTDEQLVAVALQSGSAETNIITGSGSISDNQLNSIENNAVLSLGSIDDSYSKPPSDSFAPGSRHVQQYQTIGGGPGPALPPPPGPPGGNYGPPPPPQFAALTGHSNVGAQYGPPSGNPQPFPQHGAGQPNQPVAYRPPVPAGLLESIGATVQHLDQFGVKPVQQPPTYIPPAAHEIALSGPGGQGPPPNAVYGTPFNQPPPPPPIISQQQLPQPQAGPSFSHQNRVQQFGPPGPPPPPQPQYLPPPSGHGRPLGPPPPPPSQQYLPGPPPSGLFHQQQQFQHHSENAYSASQVSQQFVHSQGLPLPQHARFNQQPPPPPQQFQQIQHFQQQQQQQQHQQQQPLVVHDCGHGPNLVDGAGYQVQQQQQQQQQQQFGSVSASSAGAYNAITQSIPVAEQHTQFLSGPADSYGPPPSGNEIDFDHDGYASQKNAVAALPDGTDPQNLPGLDGLNVISAQKSQSIQLSSSTNQQPQQSFQVQFGGSLNNNNGAAGNGANENAELSANHEEILSQGLLQSILTAIEQPQQAQSTLPQNHKAQSRSDSTDTEAEEHTPAEEQDEHEQEDEQALSASNKVEVRVLPDSDVDGEETAAEVKEIQPIVAEEIEEAKH